MIENLQNEEWKIIDGFDGMYLISNYGRLKSLKGKEERILKPNNTKYGYQQVQLWKDGNLKTFQVHRLVAMSFIPNPNNYEQVNHKDEVKTNNHVENLEWCDCKYNCNYGTRNERHSGENHPLYGKFGKDNPNAKQIIQLTLGGDYIKTWGSAIDIKRELGYHNSHICNCCKGKRKSSYGFIWRYAN